MLDSMLVMSKGGGSDNYNVPVFQLETVVSGDKTITFTALTKIKAVFYGYVNANSISNYYGYAVLANGTYEVFNKPTGMGIVSGTISGNSLTFHWNAADKIVFFALGE